MKETLIQWFIVDASGKTVAGNPAHGESLFNRAHARSELKFMRKEALQPWWAHVQWPCRIERRRYKLADKAFVR